MMKPFLPVKLLLCATVCCLSLLCCMKTTGAADTHNKGRSTDLNPLTVEEVKSIVAEKEPDGILMELISDIRYNSSLIYHGRVYENGKFTAAQTQNSTETKIKYEFEMDGYSGKILKWQKYSYSFKVKNGQSDLSEMISRDKAKEIALAKVPGSSMGDIFWNMNKEGAFYGGTIYKGSTLYKFLINAWTGDMVKIQKTDAEKETTPQVISPAQARRIALSECPSGVIISMNLEQTPNGLPYYSGQLREKRNGYAFKINGYTGNITEWNHYTVYNDTIVRQDHRKGPTVPIAPRPPIVSMPKVPRPPMPPEPPRLHLN